MTLRSRQLRNLLYHGSRHPDWIVEYMRQFVMRRAFLRGGIEYHHSHTPPMASPDALAQVLQLDPADFASISAQRAHPEEQDGECPALGGTRLHLDLLAAIVATMKPDVIVETGVARGFSTAVILTEMARNAHGHLYSLDLPVLDAHTGFIGAAVPVELRARWTLRLGPSRKHLPRLLREVGDVDVFLHDADHLYASQLREYRTAWDHLRPAGLLISDDVWVSAAFDRFASDVDRDPIVLRGTDQNDATGILVR